MRQFSNRYIFIFSSILVIVVATLLSLAATLLQPAQARNLEIEKKRNMLESINVEATRENTEELYDKYIKEGFVVNSEGNVIEGVDAFMVVVKNEQKKQLEQQYLPVFRAEPDDGEKVIIVPVEGKGLWGPLYGYVSLKSDMNTIYGTNFDHKGETPGLGAEINTSDFESQFRGKKLFENGNFISVKVLKGGADKNDPHGVDAISGGTITSKGLEKMIFDCLGKYNSYFQKNRI
ncbi:MAG TPA: NADH:ubiquinone reductase (Na(+)-transporting) subunit C [Bacteroidales bacterium]|jgi:Na+-transporting NADH:ubiquinone oxidoreductase subunit C|nr:NADH:ubiquinone reductase (Na(+)-transporting) subunit C [Bacteroidales bacterium]MDI9553100.1 NADH:ubiquinone reductase (Na(+)-transporting) subunit C [Bacteroidota bacterium]MBP7038962.1 NADH:ubiquinone reductase (Na(+)-transporting) subunit C [Bacteroidales bacterium]MZP64884.1 NADH:ubiquinone reductase (Na(+)-transporting) subunit C [Bacteroidales bacterium]HNY53598.1 NADH:ubiquinone reductase (Na(+)-transporting) subunit C [Bacteroidales bacterium]